MPRNAPRNSRASRNARNSRVSRNTRLAQTMRARGNASSVRLLRAYVANRAAARRRRGRGVPGRVPETSMLPPVPPPLPTPANLARVYRPYRRSSRAAPVRRPFGYYGSPPAMRSYTWRF